MRDVYWSWRSLLRKQVRLEHYRRGLLVKPETCAALGEKRILVRVKNAYLNVRHWHFADTRRAAINVRFVAKRHQFLGPLCLGLVQAGTVRPSGVG
jgi:hypothetical protein